MTSLDGLRKPEHASPDTNIIESGKDDGGSRTPAHTGTWADSPLGERLCDNVPLVSMTLVAALLGSLMVLVG